MSNKLENGGCKPVGDLLSTLNYYQAPPFALKSIARRAGALAGTIYLPLQRVRDVIEENMDKHRGMPNWLEIQDALAIDVSDIYHKLKHQY